LNRTMGSTSAVVADLQIALGLRLHQPPHRKIPAVLFRGAKWEEVLRAFDRVL